MKINWLVLFAFGVGVVILIFFLMKQNRKDEKKLEKELNSFNKLNEKELPNNEDGL